MTTQTPANPARAASAYRLALALREQATSVTADFPNVGAKLEEAAKLLIREGRKAEAAK